MTKKRLIDLIVDDLLDKPVWEHWTEDNIEYVSPTSKTEVSENSNINHIVLTDFTLNSQVKYLGFCSPQDPSGLDYIQPIIFTDNGQFEFYKESEWTLDEKNKTLEKLGLEWQSIFPAQYKTRVECDGKIYCGTILDFNSGVKMDSV